MKYLVRFIVITFFLLISTHTFAEQKIVVLDLKFVLNNSKAGKDAQDFLKKSFNDNVKKFSDMEKALKKEESDLLAQKTVLNKEEYTKRSDALRKKVIDYQATIFFVIDNLLPFFLEHHFFLYILLCLIQFFVPISHFLLFLTLFPYLKIFLHYH
jgi:hypothetical protein